MGLKRAVRDIVFMIIAIKLFQTGSLTLSFYASIIIFFTLYFYIGK